MAKIETMQGIATGTVRWLFIALCATIYIAIAYLASLDFRGGAGPAGGFLAWAMGVVRHVVLIPGALPLAAVIGWVLCARSWHTFLVGAALVVCILLYHYALFAVSAHSDTAYPWFQLGEFVLLWFVLKWLLRHRGTNA
jgi:hypothetical protein